MWVIGSCQPVGSLQQRAHVPPDSLLEMVAANGAVVADRGAAKAMSRPCRCSDNGDTRPCCGRGSIAGPSCRSRHTRSDGRRSAPAAASEVHAGCRACAGGFPRTGPGRPRIPPGRPGQAPAPRSTPRGARRPAFPGASADADGPVGAAASGGSGGSGNGRTPPARYRPCCSACRAGSRHTKGRCRVGSEHRPAASYAGIWVTAVIRRRSALACR